MNKRKKWTQKQIDQWNKKYPVGTAVELTNDDGKIENTKTRSEAWLLGSGHPVVSVVGRTGGYLLERIKPLKVITVSPDITNDQDLSKPGFHLMPAKPGTCQECAVAHDPTFPHNQTSLYYQYHFYAEHKRWPTWEDAMSHCTDDMKKFWREELTKQGIKIA